MKTTNNQTAQQAQNLQQLREALDKIGGFAITPDDQDKVATDLKFKNFTQLGLMFDAQLNLIKFVGEGLMTGANLDRHELGTTLCYSAELMQAIAPFYLMMGLDRMTGIE